MKVLLSLILVIIFCLTLVSFFANSSDISQSDTVDTTKIVLDVDVSPVASFSKTLMEEGKLVCSLNKGIATPEDTVIIGNISNTLKDYTMLGVSFTGLTVGKTYYIHFDIDPIFVQTFKPVCYYLRTGGYTVKKFAEIDIGMSADPKGEGYISFVAQAKSAELMVLKIPFTSDQEIISSYATRINLYCSFELFEGD